jgi:hypothetical protein
MSYEDWTCDFEKGAMLLVVLLTLLILSVGCDFQYTMYKPGASQQETLQDSYQCKQESRGFRYLSTGSAAAASDSPDWDLYKSCMEARGYTITVKD